MPHKSLHILLIEDDEVDVEYVTRGLQAAGPYFRITVVSNGLEALQCLRSPNELRPPHPYLILLDLNLPLMNGIEFLRALRQDPALRSQIVFVLSTSNFEQDKQAAYDCQVAGYLLKGELPIKWPLLLQLLDSYREVVEFPPLSAMFSH